MRHRATAIEFTEHKVGETVMAQAPGSGLLLSPTVSIHRSQTSKFIHLLFALNKVYHCDAMLALPNDIFSVCFDPTLDLKLFPFRPLV